MYTIISGTGRQNSNTLKLAKLYQTSLLDLGITAKIFDLQLLNTTHRNDDFIALEKEYLLDTTKFIVLIPEYNGSIPGIFKLMLDISDIKNVWWGKKALITGLASGRAGNNRGLDHLTNILNYLKVHTYYNKIPLSQIESEISAEGHWLKPATAELIKNQLQGFIQF
jgi:chromate reductase, NAD(P)H dehydrogenase (quinone)